MSAPLAQPLGDTPESTAISRARALEVLPSPSSPFNGVDKAFHFYYIRNMETTSVIGALSALAHQSRLGIFRLLVEQGPDGLPAGEIASRLKLANANASFHLKELAHAGLVKSVQEGRFIYYAANYKTMNGLVDYLTKNCCQGGVCDIACAPVIKRKRKQS